MVQWADAPPVLHRTLFVVAAGVFVSGLRDLYAALETPARQLALEVRGRCRRHPMIPRRNQHRIVFIAAGLYNIGWGIWSIADPQWFFRFTEMPLSNHPAIFACLGMVIGLYGILYLDIARRPERGWLPAAVGLTGKVLGPIGMVALILDGTWPRSAIVLCITNDFVWWVPFGMYLRDAWPFEFGNWEIW